MRRAAPETECVLLCKGVESTAQRMALEQRIELVPLPMCYYGTAGKGRFHKGAKKIRAFVGFQSLRWLLRLSWPLLRVGYGADEYRELQREINKLILHTAGSRYIHYLDFLRNRRVHYDKVMLTDVRDVFFQADPFPRFSSEELCFFEEDSRFPIGSDPNTSRWVRATFGQRMLRKVSSKPIICSGVTLGGFENILSYLERMESELLTRAPLNIPDQGIHNVLAYIDAFGHLNLRIIRNGEGPVCTAGLMDPKDFQYDEQGRLVSPAGEPYPVVHQFDRHPNLVANFKKLVGMAV